MQFYHPEPDDEEGNFVPTSRSAFYASAKKGDETEARCNIFVTKDLFSFEKVLLFICGMGPARYYPIYRTLRNLKDY